MKRRAFLGALTAGGYAASTEPEAILINGNFLTMDAVSPRAEAVAITAGRFLAVGSNSDIARLATARTRKIDAGGRTVVPGFIDCHSHPASSGLRHLREVDCDLRTITAIQQAIRERAAKTPKGQWILGFKYDDTKTAEGRKLTKSDLDAAAPDHAVFVNHRGGHTAYVNSRALQIADVNDKTPDPSGGRFDRDAGGRLTGGLDETAMGPFRRKIPELYTRSDWREGARLISQMMNKAGVTSVHDTGGSPQSLLAYQDARDAGELGLRVYCFIGIAHLDKMIAAGVRTGLGDEWVRVGAVKLMCDGSISERTARLAQPYIGRPDEYRQAG